MNIAQHIFPHSGSLLVLIILMCYVKPVLIAQEQTGNNTQPVIRTVSDSIPSGDKEIKRDSSGFEIPEVKETRSRTENVQGKTPLQAFRWSLLPGGGQIYNGQYIKSGLFIGGMTALTVLSIQQGSIYRENYQLYNDALSDINKDKLDWTNLENIRSKKNKARRNCNTAATAALTLYGISMLDAYTSRLVLNDRHEHSPYKAAYRSGVLPGWGQAYNRKYWKIPIVYAGFAAGGFAIYYFNDKKQEVSREYLARTRPGYGENNPRLSFVSNDALLQRRAFYNRWFQVGIIVSSLWYILNIVDATIDAHLYDFDIDDDLSFRIKPYLLSPVNYHPLLSSPYVSSSTSPSSAPPTIILRS